MIVTAATPTLNGDEDHSTHAWSLQVDVPDLAQWTLTLHVCRSANQNFHIPGTTESELLELQGQKSSSQTDSKLKSGF